MPEEKVFTIPLGESFKKARQKRVPYATRFIRRYLQQHTKAHTVKLGQKLNATLWARGIQKPPRRVRVKVMVDAGVCKAELFGHEYTEFKPVSAPKKEKLLEKLRSRMGVKAEKKAEEEKLAEGKETTKITKEEKAEEPEK
jgi:large subunit ribosomal protein L31e